MAEKLTSGDTFPQIKLAIAGGADIDLPAYCETPYTIALFYRGHW
ncbi:MAG: hypothetical protein AAF529_11895 [Pseudomonadota bacterium]